MRLLLGAYVLGSLTPDEDRTTAEHLRFCDDCQAEYLEMTEAQNLLAMITEADLMAGFDDAPEDDGRAGPDIDVDDPR
ncbi:zf-HC2 domain-containing protein [Streptomyces sp. NPDC048629]|uniref:zf-HC2 domain-containing protein n=1 Tax=Streptomyces sp. NPDC048629 TaxID=3154824 RepID=UPI00342A062D